MKLLTVVGARPQFIKAAAVSRALKGHNKINEVLLHTGQHYDDNMSEIFFREMEIPEPKYNLNIHASLQGEMTGRMIEGIEKVILKEKPDALMVYGDTNSTIAGALAATKLFVKLIHVEAGLRSFNLRMPEEINRILTDRISNLLFCPSETAMTNLRNEGFEKFECTFLNSGDVMLDSARFYSGKILNHETINDKMGLKEFILCTVHRAENTNDPVKLKNVVDALNKINKKMPIILPMHPRTRKVIDALSLEPTFTIIEPVGYLDMLKLLRESTLVITDSGGLQKESYFFKKPCICLRNDTEWVELLKAGYVVLVGTDHGKIIDAFDNFKTMNTSFSETYFGDGKASEKIASTILEM